MFWNRRPVRIAVGTFLLAAALIVLLPSMTGYTSLDGTVNARFMVISAPIEGTLVTPPPPSGTEVQKGEHLFSIRNERVNTARVSEFEAELAATRDHINNLDRQKTNLIGLRKELQTRLGAFQSATIRNLEHEIGRQRHRIAASQARSSETASDLDRKLRLKAGGYLADIDFDRTRAMQAVTSNETELSRVELKRLEDQLESARKGVFIGDNRNDVPYSLQRIDEITIALADIESKLGEQNVRADKMAKQLRDEQERVNTLGYASIRSPATGVVWRNAVQIGSNVVVGTELSRVLDCSDLFVDILMSEANYDEIFPGRPAQVRLLGRDQTFRGTVQSVRGSAADIEERTLAAIPPEQKGKNARIRVHLETSTLNRDHQNYGQIGRTAQVRFETRSFPLGRWLRSLWFSIS
jgi:multidrug resistance efflux pump